MRLQFNCSSVSSSSRELSADENTSGMHLIVADWAIGTQMSCDPPVVSAVNVNVLCWMLGGIS